MPTVSTKIKVSRDGQYIMAVGELTQDPLVAESKSTSNVLSQNMTGRRLRGFFVMFL